ncbi:MAG: 2Fe-2S iron-sulfur cluster-binding protein [archaeon]|nr:2Fe-2S iron-sulfur cluster-binding protein [archaeon]
MARLKTKKRKSTLIPKGKPSPRKTIFPRKQKKYIQKKKNIPLKKRKPLINPRKTNRSPPKRIPKHVFPSTWFVRVSRYNPHMDFGPRTHEYAISPKEGESVAELLLRLKHTQDGSLTFRSNCGHASCGSCGMRVNGRPVLGCVIKVGDHIDQNGSIRIDPLTPERVIKDLVCDEKEFFHQLTQVNSHLVPRKQMDIRRYRMSPDEIRQLGDAHQCTLCGICHASAEVWKTGGLSPAAFVKAHQYAVDARDGDATRVAIIKKHLPVPYSLEKADECPRTLHPGQKIKWFMDTIPNEKQG